MGNPNIAAYGEGIMYVPTLQANMDAIQSAGWSSVILGLFHISSAGDIGFNDVSIVSGGSYVGDAAWPGQLAQLLQPSGTNTIRTLLASFGGGGVSDFSNLQAIYEANGNSFAGTALESNFKVFVQTFPSITLIDMDVEDNDDLPSFIGFCEMLIGMGLGITFCPYTNVGFWTGALGPLNAGHPGAVKWWNLQAYDGGAGNDPATWAAAIAQAVPGFDTTGFILPGDWSRFLAKPQKDPASWHWNGHCPPAMQKLMAGFRGEPSVGGGFVWTLDQIIDYASDESEKPDPHPCGTVDMASYVQAIADGLG